MLFSPAASPCQRQLTLSAGLLASAFLQKGCALDVAEPAPNLDAGGTAADEAGLEAAPGHSSPSVAPLEELPSARSVEVIDDPHHERGSPARAASDSAAAPSELPGEASEWGSLSFFAEPELEGAAAELEGAAAELEGATAELEDAAALLEGAAALLEGAALAVPAAESERASGEISYPALPGDPAVRSLEGRRLSTGSALQHSYGGLGFGYGEGSGR